MRPCLHVVAAALVLLLGTAPARAHGLRTAYLELTETEPGAWRAELKLPTADPNVVPELPSGCAGALPPPDLMRVFAVRCDGVLHGRVIAMRGLGPVVGEAVVRVAFASGAVASRVLTPERAAWTIPVEGRAGLHTAIEYARLGFEHILGGADHLLFLLGLMLLVGTARRVLVAATAFTLAHSVTLAATALQWLTVPSQAAEAAIAVTMVLLALDLGRQRAASGVGTALVFGLVHGFGFAGALAEIGLPDGAIPLALGSFNAGVELGQMVFLAAASACVAAAVRVRWGGQMTRVAALVIGGVGSFWVFERTATWWF